MLFRSQCSRILLYHGFSKINLNRIWTGTSSNNIGMQKVCEKIGMQKEGVSRQGMYLLGNYVDVYHYGILANEFYEMEAKSWVQKNKTIESNK